MKFVRSEVRKLCRKPVLDVVIPVSSSAERASGIFGGKAGAEKQTGEQTGQEDEQQDGSDFSHGEVPL